MASFPWASPVSRATGITAESIANAAGFVGAEIDNGTNLDDTMDLEVIINCATAPTANTVLSLYVLYSLDGTNYEDGAAGQQPVGVPLTAIPARNVTGAQRVSVRGAVISPLKFKLLAWNALGQTSTTTVTAKTYRRGYAA